MRTPLLNLDHTLDSGQAFRWYKQGGWWIGVLGQQVVKLRQLEDGVEVNSRISHDALSKYFRLDDDLDAIYREISKDEYISKLVDNFRGLRLLRQDTWETAASFILATHASVPQIKRMIDNLCSMYGKKLQEGWYSFPRPEDIVEDESGVLDCKLGFRAPRLVRFARSVASGEVDLHRLEIMRYRDAVEYLLNIYGIGPKVADCIALFGLGHMEAFPVDVRMARAMKDYYGIEGNYRKVSEFGRSYFGRWAGYAQEYIYISEARSRRKEMEGLGLKKQIKLRQCTLGTRSRAP